MKTKSRVRIATFVVACLIHAMVLAQGQLTGNVFDLQHQPLPSANVLLLSPTDSSMLKGAVTDVDGMFTLKDVVPAHYLLVARMVGFKTRTTVLQVTDGNMVIAPLVLEEESTVLGEVVVEADKPLFEQRIDRLIVHVDNSIASSGGSVLDVLERSPGITVNRQSGGMSMNGKSGIQVMLNGKLQRLPLSTVIQQLEGVSAGSVDKIELISNPSSRYDAEGDAGIINIVTKKNSDEGLHGTATVGLGFSDVSGYLKPTGSTTLHYKRNDVALQASYSMNSDRRWQQWNYERQLLDRDLYSNTITDRYVTWPIQRFSAGADWSVTKQTSVNVLVSGFSDLWKMESFNHSRVAQNGTDSAHIALHDREVNHWKHSMANFNINHIFANGSKLNIDADYLYYHDHNPNHFVNDYTFSATSTHRQDQLRTSKETPIHMQVLKADYEWKVKTLKMEVGAKSTLSELKNDVKVETLQGEAWVANSKFTQAYSLRDNAHAFYVNVNGATGSRGQFQLGLRAESTDMQMSTTHEKIFALNFWKLFPSAFYTWKANAKSTWQFSYGRRITRPSYANVAPFVIFMDPFTYYWGNPQLKPAISDGLQATYTYNDLLLSLKYSRDKNAIAGNQSRYDATDNMTYIYADNVDLLQLYALSATLPVAITPWWKTQNNALLSYQKTDHVYQNQPLSFEQFSIRFSSTQTITLPHNISIELTTIYVAPRRVGLSVLKSMADISAGIQKKFPNQSKISLTITDIFWTRNSIYVNNNPAMNQIQKTSYYNEPRVLRLSYTFNFGNTKLKAQQQRKTASEMEQQRVN